MQIPVIAGAAYSAVRSIGPTLRFELLGAQHYDAAKARGEHAIGAFWHQCIFTAIWFFRYQGVVVMNTPNFDGQWARIVIERMGFGTEQGSSSRGGLSALTKMAERLEKGAPVGFSIDGPRGPRHVAKPGPVMLARRTGEPIFTFHFGLQRAWTLEKSWDGFQIPKPWTQVITVGSPPIYVSRDADSKEMHEKQEAMQAGLERDRGIAESWFGLAEADRDALRKEYNGEEGKVTGDLLIRERRRKAGAVGRQG
jgi:lysophospholipid acyltransferase (LPLAT)-like uncharacterized protein